MPKFSIGDLVLISNKLDHDIGYQGQVGIVMYIYNYQGNPHDGLSDYTVLAYDNRANRYWACGFEEKDLSYQGKLLDFIYAYNHWATSEYNYNSLFFIQTKEERDKQNKLLEEAKKEETKNNIKITPLMPVTAVSPYYDKTLILWEKVNEIIRSMNDDK